MPEQSQTITPVAPQPAQAEPLVQTPTEPGAREFSIENFNDVSPEGLSVIEKPAPAEHPEPEQPAEPAPETPETPEQPAQPEQPAEQPAAETPKAGSAEFYAKKHPDVAEHVWKGMNRAARETLDRSLDTVKELKAKQETAKHEENGNLPENWYEHEEAYMLSPEFRQASTKLAGISREQQFLQQQLANVDNAKKWFVPGYDKEGNLVPCVYGPNGALVPSAEGMEPTREAERLLEQAVARADRLRENIGNDVAQLRQGFAERVKADKSKLDTLLDTNAPWRSDEKHPLTQGAKKIIAEQLPKAYQNHPLAEMTAHTLAWAFTRTNELTSQIAERDAKIKALEGLKADAFKAPPVPSGKRGPTTPAPKTFTLDSAREALDKQMMTQQG